MKKFEYRGIELPSTWIVIINISNEIGQEGWELIEITHNSLIYKREIDPE